MKTEAEFSVTELPVQPCLDLKPTALTHRVFISDGTHSYDQQFPADFSHYLREKMDQLINSPQARNSLLAKFANPDLHMSGEAYRLLAVMHTTATLLAIEREPQERDTWTGILASLKA